jgi:hypothetical protein
MSRFHADRSTRDAFLTVEESEMGAAAECFDSGLPIQPGTLKKSTAWKTYFLLRQYPGMIEFNDAENPALPLHPRKDNPLCNSRGKENTEYLLVSELQVQRVQAERLVNVDVLRIHSSLRLATIIDR